VNPPDQTAAAPACVVFRPEDAHRRCKATRGSEILTQAWIEFATRAWEEHHDRVRAIRAANAQVSGRVSRGGGRRLLAYSNDMGRVYARWSDD
jgi:hypothetical protein